MHQFLKNLFRSPSQRYLGRLLNPKFDELEAKLEFELPASLKQFYADPERVQREVFEVIGRDGHTWDFQGFLPADPASLSNAQIAKVDGFAFASDLECQVYYLPAPAPDLKQPVLLRKFSGVDVLVAESFDEFSTFPTRDFPEEEETDLE
jgi:hypothetical protein